MKQKIINKKASMQMSISTIVMLVLALMLLGVVLGSLTGLFDSGKDELLESILLVDTGVKATSYDIIAGGDAFKLPRNRDRIIAVSFYNNGHTDCEKATQLILSCTGVDRGFGSWDSVVIPVPIGTEKTIGGVLNVHPTISSRDYICKIQVRCRLDSDSQWVIHDEQHSIFRIT